MNKVMRVLLADDHVLFRKGVASVLATRADMEVVGEAEDGLEAIAMARTLQPDIILMDIGMPNCNGLKATRVIKCELPGIHVVMLTVSEVDQDLFEAIKGGAQGYLIKDLQVRVLFDMIESVARGEAAFSGVIATKILNEFVKPVESTRPSEAPPPLTAREREILEKVAGGQSNKEIARGLAVAESTVKNHLRNILDKLHLRNRVQVAVYAVRHHIAEETPDEP